MQTQKMSLANIEGKLSRAEMKIIMVGSGSYTFNATAISGYHVASPGACSGGSQAQCQATCKSWCTSANNCASCTCS